MGNQSNTPEPVFQQNYQQQYQIQQPYQQQPYQQQPSNPQNYYQNQNQPYPNQSPPPTQQQPAFQVTSSPISQTMTIENPLNLHKKSLKIEVDSQTSKKCLTFRFDAKVECSITIYIMATEVIDNQTFYTKHFNVDVNKYQKPVKYNFKQGIGQEFPKDLFEIDFAKVSEFELSTCDEFKSFYPITVEMKSNVTLTSEKAHTQITQAILKKDGQDFRIIVKVQKILVGANKVFELEEIYGGEQTIQEMVQKDENQIEQNVGKECVICYINQKNTTVLPCRHLCLCSDCTNIVRNQNNAKCPICRKPIESFFQIKVQANQANQLE